MFNKILTATVAALTLAGATVTTTSSAQAGSFGKFIAAGIVGAVVGSALRSRPSSAYDDGHRSGYRGYGCGVRLRPVFDEYGNRAGVQRVPAC